MRNKLKSFLKRYPRIYCFIQSKMTNLPVSEVKKGLDSLNHPHRKFLVERINLFQPKNILEIGCGYGPNLYWLAKKNPNTKIRGIDINPKKIEAADNFLIAKNLSIIDIKLSVGKAEELSYFEDKSLDVVFTDAVLMYVGADKIKEVIQKMIRIANKGLVLVEWHREGPDTYNAHIGNWTRDYLKLLKQFVPKEQIKITKISKEMWPNINWIKLGYIIEVDLLKSKNSTKYPLDEIMKAWFYSWADLSGSQYHNIDSKKFFMETLKKVHKRNKKYESQRHHNNL